MKTIILCLLLIISGCDYLPSYKTSGIKEEIAEVISLTYIPHRSSSSVSPVMTMDGDLAMSISSSSFPEEWIIVLKCFGHEDTFAISNKKFFNKVKVGDIVTLRYVDKIRYYTKDKQITNEEIIDHHTKEIVFKDNSQIYR